MRTINPGEMVHEVTIQSVTDGVDASGAPQETWATLMTVWMGRESRRTEPGGESFHGDQLSASLVTRWFMRYTPEMDPDVVDVPKARRLVYLGRPHDIVSAETTDRRTGILLRTLAKSAVPA